MTNKNWQQPVTTGNTYILDIENLGHSGEGVGRFENFTVFVPYALPGEQVKVRIETVKKNYAAGRLLEIVKVSPARIEPRCPVFYQCGGCQLQHLDYVSQLAVKRQTVMNAVTRIGKLAGITVHPTLGADNPWFYRNKMQYPVGLLKGETAVGCYAQGTHEIIETETCFIQNEINNSIARQVKELAAAMKIPVYNETTGRGVLRHVLGRVGTATGEVMVVLVTATEELPQSDKLVAALRGKIPGLVSVIQNVNSKRNNVILGSHSRTLWGQDTIADRLSDFTFRISARSFFQVNTVQAEKLYNQALEYAGLSLQDVAIDAYCGTGTITLFLAKQAARVYGIEVVPESIEDARLNARHNGVSNVEFFVGDAVEVMPKLFRQGIRPKTVVVDPPRAGCAPKVLETFAAMEPERIVYVSCNPSSLARDLALLADSGYLAAEIQPVDMFPNTYHVEAIALLQRRTT
ncbi:rna methyltransferase trma active site [Lucifera butyrica]|uniref:Rna methyltransferase trma active site n=1 Tax=Lucifera butyrica TaxID=1351585 RepID=A0A498RHE3_9FIRM|nr:23S rRNA (uracil(1939)-C(5))-methyltransferase RlmD [Lucifera butyrica]VBB08558.1 rna methyltransferase trma active site [Lucifera butyrica]